MSKNGGIFRRILSALVLLGDGAAAEGGQQGQQVVDLLLQRPADVGVRDLLALIHPLEDLGGGY